MTFCSASLHVCQRAKRATAAEGSLIEYLHGLKMKITGR